VNFLGFIDQIGREDAGFKSLGEPWADTTTSAGRLMLTVLSGIAEFERDLILQRTNEGRVRAMAEGTRFGRKPKLTKHQVREALKRVPAGEPMRQIALSYNVDHSTISGLKARYAAEL
jgi:DNA invertase Pin-like site-specific DNA recombinase